MTKGRRRHARRRGGGGGGGAPENSSGGGGPAKRAGGGKKRSGSSFESFLKKRAPIYLGIAALFLVFIIPELTKGDLEGVLPELPEEDQRVVDVLMGYSGPDGTGLTVMEAISDRITDAFGDRVYGENGTSVRISVSPAAGGPSDADDGELEDGGGGDGGTAHDVLFEFESGRGSLSYAWTVESDTGRITTDDSASKHIIDVVRFSD